MTLWGKLHGIRSLLPPPHLPLLANAAWVGVSGIIGACEDQDEHDIRAQFDTNVTGLVNIFQVTLPYFRLQGGGRYIVFSSVYGLIGIPGLGREFPYKSSCLIPR